MTNLRVRATFFMFSGTLLNTGASKRFSIVTLWNLNNYGWDRVSDSLDKFSIRASCKDLMTVMCYLFLALYTFISLILFLWVSFIFTSLSFYFSIPFSFSGSFCLSLTLFVSLFTSLTSTFSLNARQVLIDLLIDNWPPNSSFLPRSPSSSDDQRPKWPQQALDAPVHSSVAGRSYCTSTGPLDVAFDLQHTN